MNENNSEYVFWLRNWKDPSNPIWPKTGQFKCLITKRKMSIISVDNNPENELNMDLSLIHMTKVSPGGKYSNQTVEIFSNAGKISLYPVTPFDPKTILIGNHSEALALAGTIDALRSNIDPQIDTNPYVRQLATIGGVTHLDLPNQLMKNELTRVEKLNSSWDAYTSPWTYDDLYGDRFLYLKTIAKIMAVILLTAIALGPVIFAIVYVLDRLNII